MPDFLKVDTILEELDLQEHMVGAEFGCGSAFFSIALARKLSKGRVYALDVLAEKLSALKGKLSLEKISNVFLILANLELKQGSTLRSNYLDVVLLPNILFQSKQWHDILKEAHRVLKPQGQMLVIDWRKAGSFGPRENIINPEEVKKVAQDLGMTLKKELSLGDYHYALLFIK